MYVALKNDQFTTVENLYYIEMIRGSFAPTFQPFSCQTYQYKVLHHY